MQKETNHYRDFLKENQKKEVKSEHKKSLNIQFPSISLVKLESEDG